MTVKLPERPHNAPSDFWFTSGDLRRRARAAGQEVWDQVSDTNVYTSFDRPGVVLTREQVRSERNTVLVHTASDASKAPF